MPNYQYKCECGNEFSVICSIKNYKETQFCPECGKESKRNVSDLVCNSIWKCDGAYGKTSK